MNSFGFELDSVRKSEILLPQLVDLTTFHSLNCTEYRNIVASAFQSSSFLEKLEDIPWLPVRIFKELEMRSIKKENIFRVLTSSGTTGQQVSKIYLDDSAARAQAEAMTGSFREVIGDRRLPMLILDSKSVTKPGSLSARGAGVLGMMNLGRKHAFALGEDDEWNDEIVRDFLDEFGSGQFLIFGFTYMVWQFLEKHSQNNKIDLSNGILIHGGGWKKLSSLAVDNITFRRSLNERFDLKRIHNFYGMVEQIGTIFLESPSGDGLYAPDFADIVIRDPETLMPLPVGEPGLIQVFSTLPRSYPGHSLLTEDIGVILGVDDGHWPGKRFSVLGRLPRAEVRGCSDTFQASQQ